MLQTNKMQMRIKRGFKGQRFGAAVAGLCVLAAAGAGANAHALLEPESRTASTETLPIRDWSSQVALPGVISDGLKRVFDRIQRVSDSTDPRVALSERLDDMVGPLSRTSDYKLTLIDEHTIGERSLRAAKTFVREFYPEAGAWYVIVAGSSYGDGVRLFVGNGSEIVVKDAVSDSLAWVSFAPDRGDTHDDILNNILNTHYLILNVATTDIDVDSSLVLRIYRVD